MGSSISSFGRAAAAAAVGASVSWAGGGGLEAALVNGSINCGTASAITGSGTHAFSTTSVMNTTDGLAHPNCDGVGGSQIERDIWWRWTADCDGVVTVDTCLSSLDTKLVVYAPLAPCPPTSDYVVACNDNSCGVRSSVSFVAIGGQEYLIRLGTPTTTGGSGTLRIQCVPDSLCGIDADFCQTLNLGQTGQVSNSSSTSRVLDDFVAPTTGMISSLCWRGGSNSVVGDRFRITYFEDNNGLPGAIVGGPFREDDGTLSVRRFLTGVQFPILGGSAPEEEHWACHGPVLAEKGERYWVEIRNHTNPQINWYWAAGVGVSNGAVRRTGSGWTTTHDRAFCVGFASFCEIDTNGDGVINFADLNNVVSFINTVCP